jgi:hypothetical protein
MWCWRRMEKISWTDHVRNEEVLLRVNEHRNILLLPGTELSLITASFGLLNDLLFPFLSILDASCPIFYLHLVNVLFDVILPSILGSSL